MPAYNLLNSQVARWKDDFKIDGIDLDLEEGAGSRKEAGPNMVHFVRFKKSKANNLLFLGLIHTFGSCRRLKQLQPDLLVSQPTYGYPQVERSTGKYPLESF